MPALPDAVYPYKPFINPVPIPAGLPTDGVTYCIQINATWLPYVLACCLALLHDSTWNSNDPAVVRDVEQRAGVLISQLVNPEACPVPIEFRPNPAYPQNFQFSLDGAITWLDGPDTASHFTPQFAADGAAPGGYDITVNGGHTSTPIPLFTATDPNAVITDPATEFRNLITASGSVEGLAVQALATIGVQLVQNNGVALALNKIPGLGLASSALETLAQGTDYTYDLLRILS